MEEIYTKIKNNFREINVKELWSRICSSNIITLQDLRIIGSHQKISFGETTSRKDLCEMIKREHINLTSRDLFKAVQNNDLSLVDQLTKSGADIEYAQEKEEKVRNSLMIASEKGYLEIVKYLVDSGANIEIKDNYGFTALILASRYGHVDIAKYLIDKGANIEAKQKDGWTALLVASVGGYLEIVKYLVEKGVNTEEKRGKGGEGLTALKIALRKGHLEIVNYFISDIESKLDDGSTALIFFSQEGDFEIVKYLVENGANIEAKKISTGSNPLIVASGKGYLAIVKYLVERGANIEAKSIGNYTPLMFASYRGRLEIVKYLVEKGAKIETKGIENYTALTVACEKQHWEIAKYLVESGANIEVKDDHHESTPLMFASLYNNLDFVKYLVEKGANIEAKANDSLTSLLIASHKGHVEIVKYLLEKGANIQTKTTAGYTALTIASIRGHLEIVKDLVENGANVEEKNVNEDNALTLAVKNKHLEIVKYLVPLSKKEDITRSLWIAKKQKLKNIVLFLEEVIQNSFPGYIKFAETLKNYKDPVFISEEICKPGVEYEGKEELKKALELRDIIFSDEDTKETMCKKLEDYKKPKDTGGCENETTILGDPLESIPDGLFYSYLVNGKKFCLPITELKDLKLCPYTKQPIPGLDKIKKLTAIDVYFPEEEEVKPTYSQLSADLLGKVPYLSLSKFDKETDLETLQDLVSRINDITAETMMQISIENPEDTSKEEKYKILEKVKQIIEENGDTVYTIRQVFDDYATN